MRTLWLTVVLGIMVAAQSQSPARKTIVSIEGGDFLVNGRPTYSGRTFDGMPVQGLLFNSRMVQGIFDDRNPETRARWNYPDGPWDAERNTREFIDAMPLWRAKGLLAFTINLQGGSPEGYSRSQPWITSAFETDGALRPDYMSRLERILDRADALGMVAIVGFFYQGQERRMNDERSIVRAADAATDWLIDKRYTHVLIEVANEADNAGFTHDIIKPAGRALELIDRLKNRSAGKVASPLGRLPVSTSLNGGVVPSDSLVKAVDFVLLHGNGVRDPARISQMVEETRKLPSYRGQPIVFNEDDHFDFAKPENNLLAALRAHASWGYFDYRLAGERFDDGYQSVPVNWTISSQRKREFFDLVERVTGASVRTEGQSSTVTLVPPAHGNVHLAPPLPADGRYAAGTVVTMTATPDPGYVLDSMWYSVPGRFGQMYHEGMARKFMVTIDQDKRVGASFIEESAVKDLLVSNDIVYAKPGVKPLKYDVFSPRGARNLPIIVVIHGGGWTANDEDIMRGLARELTKGGRFVVASMDYRWSGTADGDATGNTMANLIEDVFGGIAHIMEHATAYGGDATRVGVTGDSAGGHLAAVASLMTDKVGSRGFGRTPGVFEFMPSYLPAGKTAEQVRDQMLKAIKSAAPSYGVFSAARLNTYSDAHANDQVWKEAIAPLNHIPQATERSVPQFLTRGTRDTLISDEGVTEFVDALVKAGQRVEYVQVGGASHAFFDWKPADATKATFAKYGVYYAAAMRNFFLATLY